MKRLALIPLLLLSSAALSPAALAQSAAEPAVTGNLSFATDYRFRGISQTNAKPALQGGFDFEAGNGLYVGTWASNVNWLADGGGGAVSNSMEWDVYGGYKATVGEISYNVGLLYYAYPGSYPDGFNSPNTLEAYGGIDWKSLSVKYSHGLTDLFGFEDSKGAGYLELSTAIPVGDYEIGLHAGHQLLPSTSGRSKSDCSYTDWKISVGRSFAGFDWGLAYVDSNAKGGAGQCYRNAYDKDLGKGTVVLTVGKTF